MDRKALRPARPFYSLSEFQLRCEIKAAERKLERCKRETQAAQRRLVALVAEREMKAAERREREEAS